MQLIRTLLLAVLTLPVAAVAQSSPYRVDLIVFLNQATPNGAPDELSAPLDDFALPEATVELDDAAALGVAGVRLLPDAQFGLPEAWQRMRNARAFLPIERHAWTQRDLRPASAAHLRLRNNRLLQVLLQPEREELIGSEAMGDEPEQTSFVFGPARDVEPTVMSFEEPIALYQLDGTVQLYQRRFLHLALDLRWTQMDDGSAARSGGLLPETALRSFRLTETRRMRRGQLHYFDHPRFGVLARVVRADAVTASSDDDVED